MVTDTLIISIMPNDLGMGGGCSQGRRGGTGASTSEGLLNTKCFKVWGPHKLSQLLSSIVNF